MKAILILDKMPERCADCQLKSCITNHADNSIEFICSAMKDLIICDVDESIDENCPLMPFDDSAGMCGNKDYKIYKREWLLNNLDREMMFLKNEKKYEEKKNESSIGN